MRRYSRFCYSEEPLGGSGAQAESRSTRHQGRCRSRPYGQAKAMRLRSSAAVARASPFRRPTWRSLASAQLTENSLVAVKHAARTGLQSRKRADVRGQATRLSKESTAIIVLSAAQFEKCKLPLLIVALLPIHSAACAGTWRTLGPRLCEPDGLRRMFSRKR